MNRISLVYRVVGIACLALATGGLGVVTASAQAAADNSSTNALSTEDITAYANLNKSEFETGAQARLARELAQTHLQRAEAAKKNNQPDKAQWETELANELAEKANALQKQMGETTKQRTAFEEGHKVLGSLLFGIGPKGLDADETAFLTRLDERLFKANQELMTTIELGNSYTATLQTNTTPQQIARVSEFLEQNNKMVRQLEREKALFELQALEYRALRRR